MAFVTPLADATADATLALAILTGVLAMATVLLAALTYYGISSARKDADRQIEATRETAANEIEAMRETTSEQVAAAREELDAAHRPLFIEVFPTGPIYPDMGARDDPNINPAPGRQIRQTIHLAFPGREESEIDPRVVFVAIERGMAFISVPLRNVGRGLAVIDQQEITIEGVALGQFKTGPLARRVRVPASETTRVNLIVEFQAGGAKISRDDRWLLRVPYTDFAGRQRTVAAIKLGYTGEYAADGPWYVMGVDQEI
jgi:hypothetical protein